MFLRSLSFQRPNLRAPVDRLLVLSFTPLHTVCAWFPFLPFHQSHLAVQHSPSLSCYFKMLNGAVLSLTLLATLSLSDLTLGRILWAEKGGRAVLLNPRRLGQEHPQVISDLGSACPGQVCGVFASTANTPLLAAQGEGTQQDMADKIIDASKQFDAATQANMLALAKEYRQAEKSTPPDFTINPPTLRNSVFCQKAPKHPELNCLVQKQDPANDPNLFFDPAKGQTSVKKGTQANTQPQNDQATLQNSGNDKDTTPTNTDTQTRSRSSSPSSPSATPSSDGWTQQKPRSSTQNNAKRDPASNTGKNLQTFTGSLGSAAPAVIQLSSEQFQVQGDASYMILANALRRSWCDLQMRACADAANASGNMGDLTVTACETQHQNCVSAPGN
ncbi:hypothetical protein EDB86DRAFT_2908786 [Lactarius hatsudake]|nr:hypothetical protein EDB86DRAFT_2908786 [Lactarius hatsudake]